MGMTRWSLVLVGALACAASAAARAQSGWQPSVWSVRVTPSEGRLQPGQQLRLIVSALDATGAPLDGVSVAFSTSDPHVATVGDDGVVLAVAPGTATVTAQVGTGPGARSARAQIRVEAQGQQAAAASRAPSIRSVQLMPASGRIHVGEQLQLHARAQDMRGDDAPFAQIVYTSGDAHIATVSDDGVVSGVSAGKVTITARVGSGPGARSATAEIEILPVQP
jgi:uncharacterized protein YjdB